MQGERERLKVEFESTDGEETKLKESEIKLKFDYQTYENLVKDNHGKVAHWKKEVKISCKLFFPLAYIKLSVDKQQDFSERLNTAYSVRLFWIT